MENGPSLKNGNKIVWLSRHPLTAEQLALLQTLHGSNLEIDHVYDFHTPGPLDLARILCRLGELNAFPYVVANHVDLMIASQCGAKFGVFTKAPDARHEKIFRVQGIYHVNVYHNAPLRLVWYQGRLVWLDIRRVDQNPQFVAA